MPEYYADPVAEALAKAGPKGYEHGWNHTGAPGTWEHAVHMQQRAHEIAHGSMSALENPHGHGVTPEVRMAEHLDQQRQQANVTHWHPRHSDPVIDRLHAAMMP
jgi:hypothetical protein